MTLPGTVHLGNASVFLDMNSEKVHRCGPKSIWGNQPICEYLFMSVLMTWRHKHVFVTDVMSLTSREKNRPVCEISLEILGPFV